MSQRLVYIPLISVEKIGKSFTDVPQFVLRQGSKSQNSSYTPPPPPPPHGGFRVSFLASTRDPNVARSSVLPLSSQRGPQKAIPNRLQTIRNSTTSIPLCQFSPVFKTEEWFFLPVFRKFQSGAMMIGPLNL
ncbi:hypothetical protein AVEN_6948-1 [Araneus ventricosus]|uniref:Uncharacterized protein n=1 Tax=Araneus ventricosus TaxID=182803 RepID=A0A4Y2GM19_ARAVE|nr:hypothetical protein AVEN_6948-1 [Araneus ventricosus]